MRLLLIASSCLLLNGCWFFFFPIPGASSVVGNACIQEGYFSGDRITSTETKRVGTVKERHGRHQRCQVASHPILATVEYEQ